MHMVRAAPKMAAEESSDKVSVFSNVKPAPPDAVFNVLAEYKKDTHPKKVNLSVGAYRDEEGQPWVLPVVKTIEAQMSSDPLLNHEYLPIDGLKSFTEAATRLVLGTESLAITQNRYCAIQCISGTGSIRLALEIVRKFLMIETIYVSSPTWSNHHGISKDTGFANIKVYRYFDQETRGLDIEGMKSDLSSALPNSAVILHTCAHNPTGVDPTQEEWKEIIAIIKKHNIFPIMDTAYIGFASGDIDEDSWPLREMDRQGVEFFITQSFSKNFGLYNERVGQLCCVLSSAEVACILLTQLKVIARRLWSNPPHHGARIVATALNNPTLYQEWLANIETMTGRIKVMREELYQRLVVLGTPGDWTHIIKQIGMFSFTGLTAEQAKVLVDKYHIYLLSNGRINICGLNYGNIGYVANAIHEVVMDTK